MFRSSFFRFSLLLMSFAVLLLSASPAAAQHRQRDHNQHRVRSIDVAFDSLDVRVVRGQLRVSYAINGRDWRTLQNSHIRPKLNLYTPEHRGHFTFARATELTHRTGELWFPRDVTPDRGRRVEVRLTGDRGRTRIGTTSFGEACGDRVQVAMHRPAPRREHRDTGRVALIEACGANTTWSGDLNKCIEKGGRISQNAPQVIAACGVETSWSGDFMKCLDLSATLPRTNAQTVRACGTATTWSGAFETCLKQAQFLGPHAPRVVNSCDAATSWSGEFEQCLVAARRS